MKMLLLTVDAARLDEVRHDLRELDVPGYTVLPALEGAGSTGVHTGDRVHPGAIALVLVVVEDTDADRMFDRLEERRRACGDSVSRLFLVPVERHG